MADDTLQTGTDTIATDHVTTLNGVGVTQTSTSPKVQRVKVAYGDDGTARDVSPTFPLPIDTPDTTATGSLTAVGSVTVSTIGGNGIVGIQITGTFVATVVFEATTDGTNFFSVNGVASVSGAQVASTTVAGQWRVNAGGYTAVRTRVSAFTSGTVASTLVASAASTMATLAEPLPIGANQIGTIGEQRAATLAVTVAGVAATAATLTLPAPAAGLFHYITSLTIDLYSTAARTGVAAPIVVTSTNLPGSLAWTFSTAGVIGAIDRYVVNLTTPLKSSTAATATTVVGPAVTGGLWRINASYFTAV